MADPTQDNPTPQPDEIAEDTSYPDHVDPDVPEADALEQAREWSGDPTKTEPTIPIDVNEADALEQEQEPGGQEEEYR